MEVRNDVSYRSQSYKPAFGTVEYKSAEETLRKVFSLEELNNFKKLVNESKKYTNCDFILFGEGKKLYGRLADTADLKDGYKSVEVSPWFFENKYKWVAKMAAKMRNRHNEVTELLNKQNFQF